MSSLDNRSYFFYVLAVFATYIPFLNYRVLRMAGDEKVYISQALEMFERGNWFQQVLFGEANYYKGPLHYLFVILGFHLFGTDSLWPALYMNVLFILLGGSSLYWLGVKHFKNRNLGLSLALWFSLGIGVYCHALVSQMEIELAGLFAFGFSLAFFCLPAASAKSSVKSSQNLSLYAFWIVAGLVGWSKSPLHSVFLGLGGVLIFLGHGTEVFVSKLKSRTFWKAWALGVAVCCLGYFPAYWSDTVAFTNTYLLKETLYKSSSGQTWNTPLESTFGFYLSPWLLIAAGLYPLLVLNLLKGRKNNTENLTIRSSLLFTLPSVAFFMWHPYRFENYNLPIITGVITALTLTYYSESTLSDRIKRNWLKLSIALTALLIAAIGLGLGLIFDHFSPLPAWLSSAQISAALGGLMLCSALLFALLLKPKALPGPSLWFSFTPFFFSVGILISVLGEREMIDLRIYSRFKEPTNTFYYLNFEKNIWNEGPYLSLMIPHPVKSITNESDLPALLKKPTVWLTTSMENLENFTRKIVGLSPRIQIRTTPWTKWRTRGTSESGKPLWQEAWQMKDLEILTRKFWIIETRPQD